MVKGVALRRLSFRGSWVQIPPPAPLYSWKGRALTTLGVEFARRLPKLFPENGDVSIRSLNELSLKELSIYESKDVAEKAIKILKHLNEITR